MELEWLDLVHRKAVGKAHREECAVVVECDTVHLALGQRTARNRAAHLSIKKIYFLDLTRKMKS